MPDEITTPQEESENPSYRNDSNSEDDDNAIIPGEVEEIIKDLPDAQRKAVKAVLLGRSIEESWRGPLPAPHHLKQYNDAVPDGAERILRMTEAQARHRQDLEKIAIPGQLKESRLGQLFAFILALAFLLCQDFLSIQDMRLLGLF